MWSSRLPGLLAPINSSRLGSYYLSPQAIFNIHESLKPLPVKSFIKTRDLVKDKDFDLILNRQWNILWPLNHSTENGIRLLPTFLPHQMKLKIETSNILVNCKCIFDVLSSLDKNPCLQPEFFSNVDIAGNHPVVFLDLSNQAFGDKNLNIANFFFFFC